ncbi:hypothetical protein FOL47_004015, partial [Perkinsus chesapeaki]
SLEAVPEVYDRAMDVAMRTHYQWVLITSQLHQAFGDRVAMRDEVTRRLHALKFKGYQFVDEFIHQLILISNMWMTVHSEGSSESRYLLSSFLSKLPADSLQSVVDRLLREIPKEGAPIWEDYVRLHSTAPPPRFSPSVDLCETLRAACKSVEITHHLQPRILADRARQVADQGAPRRGPTITDWASRFPEGTVIYFRTDKSIPLEDVRKTFSSLGAREIKAHIHKRGHRYGFATFPSANEATKLATEGLPSGSEGASQGLQIRSFVPGGFRGGDGVQSDDRCGHIEPDDYDYSSL